MSILELRKSLHKIIDSADERFLRMVNSMADEYEKGENNTVTYRAGKPMTKKQLYRELKESEAEIENGKYMSLDDFAKESEQWD